LESRKFEWKSRNYSIVKEEMGKNWKFEEKGKISPIESPMEREIL
jgi:hypothetical protein